MEPAGEENPCEYKNNGNETADISKHRCLIVP
jgi:hypothetical protein